MTLTFVRSSKPVKLMRQLREDCGCVVREVAAGIYYVEGRVLFSTQIIVTDEFSQDDHASLKAISEKEPGAELYRKVAYRSGIENTEEKAYIRDITRRQILAFQIRTHLCQTPNYQKPIRHYNILLSYGT